MTRRALISVLLPLVILTALITPARSIEKSNLNFLSSENSLAALFSGTPYTGTPISLPGRIEAENFDNGGEGVAYHDTTSTNDGGYYRSTGVDICTCGSPYGYSVGWTQNGEWMEYTVSVATYGTYKFQTLTATTVSGTALHIEVDGVNVTGQMTLPNTGAWGSYAATSSSAVTLTPGQHIVRVAIDVTGFLLDSVDVIRLNTPYGGTAPQLPGAIPAENFDNGGEGIAYHDTTAANEGGAYRSEGVDLCFCGYSTGAAIGWSQTGEWTRYTVNFTTTDTYTLQATMSTILDGCVIHLEVDGVNVTGPMALPNTGAWGAWTTISKPNIQISAGQHEIKMVIDSGGFLLDSLTALPSVPIAPSGLTANAVSATQINLAWVDNSFNESGFKLERKTGPSGTYSEIATPAAGVTSFSDTDRQPSTQYFYRVRATNTGGDSAYSNEASAMTSNLLPSVSVTSPAAGSVFAAPANITIAASAADPDGTVSKVEFFEGSTKLGEDLSAPYTFNWTNVSAGPYSLTAKATDNLSGIAISAPVAITVNVLPTVSITAPAANAVFNSPANVTIDASASDSDGTISKVEFYQGANKLGEDLSAPYSFNWTNVSAGTYSLNAKATDNLGSITTSASVAITVNVLPTVSITAPAANAVFNAPANVTIDASASDSDGTVSKVEFFQGSTKLGEDLSAPYTFNWTNVSAGTYSLTAKATDNLGGITPSAPVAITVNALPTTSITAPAANTVFNPLSNVTINASASDADGTISKVEFFQNGTLLGEDTTSPYSYVWITAPIGTFSLTARATDNRNATATSDPVMITVNNPPSVSISAPPPNSIFAAGSTISIAATSSDTDGTVSKVEFYQGSIKLGEDLTAPYSFDWTNVQAGSYSLLAAATDNQGAMTITATVPITVITNVISRLDPKNRTGGANEDPLSRNFNWSVPLVNLSGRAGLDLNLSLSYNSLVWTKAGTLISFDDDRGFPSPGFRLGFPTIQPTYLNPETNQWSYLLIASDGSRTELRRVSPTSVFYEAADSSHLVLDTTDLSASDPKMVLIATSGKRMTYKLKGAAYECTEIKDRNGNYITINYNSAGKIADIHDTLDRTITFVYDNGWLTSIEQQWKKPSNPATTITHTWASFAYTNVPLETNFAAGIAVNGPTNETRKMLTKVTLDDNSTTASENSHYDFEYTSWGQVWKIKSFAAADNHLLNYRSYNLPQTASNAQNDCPRFTERYDWAERWNQNSSGVEQEAVTTYSDLQSGTATVPERDPETAKFVQVTNPDQTFTKIYFLGTAGTTSGWRVGLPYLVESYDAGGTTPQRQTVTDWTQDDETKAYILNPRIFETNIFDSGGNRKRTDIQYQSYTLGNGMSCQLPKDVREYAADASSVLRTSRTIYIDDSTYFSRRLIGLPKERYLYEGIVSPANLRTKVELIYDETGSIDGNDAPDQHDTAYSSSFVSGRGNLSKVKRFNVANLSQFTTSTMKYNTAGGLVSSKDALERETKISYADSFSDGVTRTTLAYPTKVTDPDNYYLTSQYNFDFGALTYQQTPPPNFTGPATEQPAGPERSLEYYDYGRLKKLTNLVNNAYTMYVYEANGIRTNTNTTIQEGLGEAHSFTITDGAGRVIATAMDNPANPGKTGAFRAQIFVYDVVGRKIKTSNHAETDAVGNDPTQWTTTDHDEVSGWIYTQQSYDWKDRPKVTTNVDGSTKQIDYSGCGCAGGEVMTLTDEGTLINGVHKRRQQKVYSDVLGRTVKSEIWDFEGTGPGGVGRRLDSTTVTSYNARDQVTTVRQFAGAPPNPDDLTCPNGTCQKSDYTYDGYGRLETKHVPGQDPTVVTAWTYNADDTVNTVTDGRGAVTTYGYAGTNRKLVTSITHALTGNPTINLSYDYDAAGNRVSMDHSVDETAQDSLDYVYDQLSRLTSETRHINALESNPTTLGDYTIEYEYTLSGNLKSVTDPFNATMNINYDATGRTLSVTDTYAGVNHTYVSNVGYRAWGGVRSMTLGSLTETRTYNQRQQPTQYRYAQFRYDYTYHPDGKLKELIDLDDQVGAPSQVQFHYMSRLYSYDYVGRVADVSGRPNTGVPSPFLGNYSFDAFGNMSRSGRFALDPMAFDSPTYHNNRRTSTDWSYDADGRVTASKDTNVLSTQTWAYDARGNAITVTETVPAINPTTTTNTRRFDGNGDLLFESVSNPFETNTNYLINSTVLGTPLIKLDASGNKHTTYVPANGLAMPTQGKDFNGNPAVGIVSRDVSGLQEGGKAIDPFGARVMNVQPPDSTAQTSNTHVFGPDYGGYGLSRFTNANNITTGCMLDGVRASCGSVMDAISRGRATGVVSYNGSAASIANLMGFMPMTHRTTTRVGPGNTIYYDDRGNPYPAYGTQRYETTISTEFVPILGYDVADTDPQKPKPSPTPDPCDENKLLTHFNLRDEAKDDAVVPYINNRVAEDFLKALLEINQKVQGGIGFNSAFRTRALQEREWNRYNSQLKEWNDRSWLKRVGRTPPLIAKQPGTSSHEGGFAFDIPLKYITPDVERIFNKHGFARDEPNDPIHFQWSNWKNLTPVEQQNLIKNAVEYYNKCIAGRN